MNHHGRLFKDKPGVVVNDPQGWQSYALPTASAAVSGAGRWRGMRPTCPRLFAGAPMKSMVANCLGCSGPLRERGGGILEGCGDEPAPLSASGNVGRLVKRPF